MKEHLQQLLKEAIASLQLTDHLAHELLDYQIRIERAKDEKHGDYATSVALSLAKGAKKPPRALAEELVKYLPDSPHVEKVEIAGPGFINFFIHQTAHQNIIPAILEKGDTFGQSRMGESIKVHLEFVSANPTGPLHVGHGRGAAYGSACAAILSAVGYDVHREYYVNDAGRQMNILAVSIWLRYLELLGEKIIFPVNGYRGDYVIEIAKKLKEKHGEQFKQSSEKIFVDLPLDEQKDGSGDKELHIDGLVDRAKTLLGKDFDVVHRFGTDDVLADIKDDLAEFGVEFDEWFSEKSLMDDGSIDKALAQLKAGGYLYENEGAVWFKSTEFGDEKDRVLVRENGVTTYFASDVAYHWNKLARGYKRIIDVLGADHHGYVPRVKAAMQALGLNAEALYVPLVQFAVLYRGKDKVQMSTRSGEFVTLRELRDEVGRDAARFFYVMRKAEQHMDFDLELAKSKTNENPVYYIQYAYARICSVFRQLKEKSLSYDRAAGLDELERLETSYEKTLLVELEKYPEIVLAAAVKLEPHLIANYLKDLAAAFHAFYNSEKVLVEDEGLRQARLCLLEATRQLFKNGLSLLNVSAPEEM